MTAITSTLTVFFSLLLESTPFILLGVIVSSALLVFIEQNQWRSHFPRHPLLGALIGSGLGLFFPVGQYGIIPIARRFFLQGLPLPIIISFLIAAPTINPIVLYLSWKIFAQYGSVNLFYWRIIFTSAIAILMGSLFALLTPPTPPKIEENSENVKALVMSSPQPKLNQASRLIYTGSSLLFPLPYQPLEALGKIIYHPHKQDGTELPKSLQIKLFRDNISRELLEWGSLLIIGCAIASILSTLIPQNQILTLGTTPKWQIISLLIFGAIISVGTIKNSVLATSLLSTFSSGSILAFLLTSSIIDLKTLTFLFANVKLKFAVYFVVITSQLILLSSLFFDFYLS